MNEKNGVAELIKVLSSETKLGILFSLQFYDSLNLKQIADVVGIKMPSAFEHVKGRRNEKGLLEMDLIEEDGTQIGRGKYYKLTELALEFLRSIKAGIKGEPDDISNNNEIAELINIEDQNNLEIITKFLRNISIVAKNFATYTANFVEQKISIDDKYIQDELKNQIYINFSYLNIKTSEHKKRLNDIFIQYGKAIHEISEESKKLKDFEIDEKYFIYTFSTSLNLIDPRKQ